MTTAARPTFEPARGGKGKGEGGDLSALSKQYSSRDLPGHTRLKYRYNFNFILPKVNTEYIRQAQVLNIDKLRLIIYIPCMLYLEVLTLFAIVHYYKGNKYSV